MSSKTNGEAWEVRAARNQSLFRAVNERLTGVAVSDPADRTLAIACECADTDCTETLEISTSEYEQLREHPNRFAVLGRHVFPEVEDVLEAKAGYTVVAKRGKAGEVASAFERPTRD